MICNYLQFQKVLFWEEMYEFYFVANWWLWMLLSVVSVRYAQFFFNYLFSVYCLNFTLQWSPISKSTILEANVSVLFITSGDNGCCSQWSVIRYAQFFFNYLFLFFDKSVYCLNFTLQWSPVSKSTILGRNVRVLFIT